MNYKYPTKELTKSLLLLLLVGISVPALVAFPALGIALKPLLKNNYQPSRISGAIKRLERQKLISISEAKGLTRIELLDKGRKRILTYRIEELKLKRSKWDGVWRLVIFDIPEKRRVARDFLRAKLRELGFYQLQKSVLITPWECKEIIDFVKYYYDVSGYVDLLIIRKIENDHYLKSYFNL